MDKIKLINNILNNDRNIPSYYIDNIDKVIFNEEKKNLEIDWDMKWKFSLKNRVNDLTWKEWKFATKTVINKPYPFNLQHKLRKEHWWQKPPELCADIIKIFTKENDVVLDPFVWVWWTLLWCSLVKRKWIWIDLNKRWKEIYNEVCDLEELEKQDFNIWDSLKVLDKIEDNSLDFVLTDIPYWDMDKIKHTRWKNANKSSLWSFNNEELKSKETWINDMKKILLKSYSKLKIWKYMAIFIWDIYFNNSYHILHADIANAISSDKLVLKSNIVWYDVSKSLHVYGYPYSYVPSLIHQNILILKKEK